MTKANSKSVYWIISSERSCFLMSGFLTLRCCFSSRYRFNDMLDAIMPLSYKYRIRYWCECCWDRMSVTLVSGIGVMSSFSGSGILVTSANASSTLSSATDMPIVGILAVKWSFKFLELNWLSDCRIVTGNFSFWKTWIIIDYAQICRKVHSCRLENMHISDFATGQSILPIVAWFG